MTRYATPVLGPFAFFAVAFALSAYFTFAAVQGDFGLFKRAEVEAEIRVMRTQRDTVASEVLRMENLTLRLSDDYLDLDLLDEQSRRVLGLVRHDEIVIR